jgi:hypothetical protein
MEGSAKIKGATLFPLFFPTDFFPKIRAHIFMNSFSTHAL